ncbi:hypothetical protein AB0C04_17270 [Micromonospora sp. NPDC048909]|uniref:hypothetical protein n=1 Tax=Micromonospora sp. NPDC048909 TaxID=3155643 RepID=UPI00340928C5
MITGDVTSGAGRRRVPPIIVGSSLLLALSGLARLAQVAAEAAVQDTYLRAHERVGTPSAFAALPMMFLMGVGLLVALSAVTLLLLSLANLAGWNWTRVGTWALGGVTLMVAACGLALDLIPTGGASPDTTDWDAVHAVAAQLMPGWAEPVGNISGLVASPALLCALVLLALPPANAFYRKQSDLDQPVVYSGATVTLHTGHPTVQGSGNPPRA